MASQWGLGAVRLLYEWTQRPAVTWTEAWARSAYDWFSEKTKSAPLDYVINGLVGDALLAAFGLDAKVIGQTGVLVF